jgi:hypothetical protein
MKAWVRSCMVVSLLSLGGCFFADQNGRLVGFLVNGQTGERINLFPAANSKNNRADDANGKNQVWAIINGEFRRARPCGTGDLNSSNGIDADGCYQIENIPLDMEFPLFANVEGYERFHGQVLYPLPDTDVELDRQNPQIVGNIRLFPKGYAVDYRVQVSYLNRPMPGVKVICQYLANNANTVGVDGSFLQPQNTTSGTVSSSTDENGVALLPGNQFVIGARYNCEAISNQSVDGRLVSADNLSLTAGVTQSNLQLTLTASGVADNSFYALYSNVDSTDVLLGANAQLRVTFNRPVEILPGTEDCQVATLSAPDTNQNGVLGTLPTNAVGGGSETVNASLSSDGLTLTLSLRGAQNLDPGDLGTRAFFDGIVLRPRGADNRVVRYIGAIAGCTAATVYGTQAQLRNLRTGGLQNNTLNIF